jgi:DNA invertase Pin-like site-specific DNA recombinase
MASCFRLMRDELAIIAAGKGTFPPRYRPLAFWSTFTRPTKPRIRDLRELVAAEWPQCRIAAALGIAQSTVSSWKQKYVNPCN